MALVFVALIGNQIDHIWIDRSHEVVDKKVFDLLLDIC